MAVSFDLEGLCYLTLAVLLLYSVADAFLTRRLVRKGHDNLPFVGSPWVLTPSFILNLVFATKAAGVLEQGYHKVIHIKDPTLNLHLHVFEPSMRQHG